jgi:hypothetical protein
LTKMVSDEMDKRPRSNKKKKVKRDGNYSIGE